MSQVQRINFITSKYNKLYNPLQKVVSREYLTDDDDKKKVVGNQHLHLFLAI